jgi:hypothetical protein
MNDRDSWKEYELGAWAQQLCAVVASPFFLVSNRLASEDTAMYLCIVAVGPVECHRTNSEELYRLVSLVRRDSGAILALQGQTVAGLFDRTHGGIDCAIFCKMNE